MSVPVSVYYTNDLFSPFSAIRKRDWICLGVGISKIDIQPSGVICAITSIAMSFISLSVFNPYVKIALAVSSNVFAWIHFLSTIREVFAKSRCSDSTILV